MTYEGKNYTPASPLAYFSRSKERHFMHPRPPGSWNFC